jgi:hypothetical protein
MVEKTTDFRNAPVAGAGASYGSPDPLMVELAYANPAKWGSDLPQSAEVKAAALDLKKAPLLNSLGALLLQLTQGSAEHREVAELMRAVSNAQSSNEINGLQVSIQTVLGRGNSDTAKREETPQERADRLLGEIDKLNDKVDKSLDELSHLTTAEQQRKLKELRERENALKEERERRLKAGESTEGIDIQLKEVRKARIDAQGEALDTASSNAKTPEEQKKIDDAKKENKEARESLNLLYGVHQSTGITASNYQTQEAMIRDTAEINSLVSAAKSMPADKSISYNELHLGDMGAPPAFAAQISNDNSAIIR